MVNLFDTIVSRAFFITGRIYSNYPAAPARTTGGRLLAMKGAYPAEELADIPKDFEVESVRELSIVGFYLQSRHLVIIKRKGKPWENYCNWQSKGGVGKTTTAVNLAAAFTSSAKSAVDRPRSARQRFNGVRLDRSTPAKPPVMSCSWARYILAKFATLPL